ncbi:MAG: nucleoside kinase, partial [Bacillota bacterium]
MRVILDGKTLEVSEGTKVLDIVQPGTLACKVDNYLESLSYEINNEVEIKSVTLSSVVGQRIFERSLVFVLVRATRELYPNARVVVRHSISNGIFVDIKNVGKAMSPAMAKTISQRMRQIIDSNEIFVKEVVRKRDAEKIFLEDGQLDKIEILRQRPEDYIPIFSLGWYKDYTHLPVVYHAGLLKDFELKFYLPGFILVLPSYHHGGKLGRYVEQPKLAHVFMEEERQAEILEVSDVSSLNRQISTDSKRLILISEALHSRKITEVVNQIIENPEKRLILIAGPSSSGKTTLSHRLLIQLQALGLKPVSISLDDYFVDRENTPLGEDGQPDFENIRAIELDLFNDHLARLMQGETVETPTYNFKLGKRDEKTKKLKVGTSSPIIIEGIHGLNEELTDAIPKNHKYKIYISALTQLNIDDHNRVPTTDARLLRRIVRDNRSRGHDAVKTLKMWPKVRRGEEKYIFPFQEEADIMINSSLPYELAVLKPYVEPLLTKVAQDENEFTEAQRLLSFLRYFVDL